MASLSRQDLDHLVRDAPRLHLTRMYDKPGEKTDVRLLGYRFIYMVGRLANEPLACRQLHATYVTCARIIPPPSNFALN